jgi:hypothetical protein
MLLAAGAVVIEAGIARTKQTWLQPAIIVLLLAVGAWFAPFVVPVLSIDHFISYMNNLPFNPPRTEHGQERAVLPQHYADQFGWEELTAKTAEASNRLTPEERNDCPIFAQNYGQAGTIDFFITRYITAGTRWPSTYFLWGPHGYSGNCMIVLDDIRNSRQTFERLNSSAPPAASRLERHIPVFICRDLNSAL